MKKSFIKLICHVVNSFWSLTSKIYSFACYSFQQLTSLLVQMDFKRILKLCLTSQVVNIFRNGILPAVAHQCSSRSCLSEAWHQHLNECTSCNCIQFCTACICRMFWRRIIFFLTSASVFRACSNNVIQRV